MKCSLRKYYKLNKSSNHLYKVIISYGMVEYSNNINVNIHYVTQLVDGKTYKKRNPKANGECFKE